MSIVINDNELVNREQKLSNKERYGNLSEKEYNELMHIRASFERELKRKRRDRRIERAKRSEALVKKHRVSSKWFEELVEKNSFVKIKTDTYGKVQRG